MDTTLDSWFQTSGAVPHVHVHVAEIFTQMDSPRAVTCLFNLRENMYMYIYT